MPERLHPTISMFPDPSGQFMRYQTFAAGPVTPGATAPTSERVPLLCRYPHGNAIMTFYDGRFRHPTTGTYWSAPIEWAYITWVPMADDTVYTPGPVGPESKQEWLYDTMKVIAKHWKFRDVQDIADKITWPNDREGVPEE